MADLPHFSLPFRFSGPAAAVNEQDSLDEIGDCVLAVLVCPEGFRIELPSFGLLDQAFAIPGPSLAEIRDAVATWERRAQQTLSQYPDTFDELTAHVLDYVRLRTEA